MFEFIEASNSSGSVRFNGRGVMSVETVQGILNKIDISMKEFEVGYDAIFPTKKTHIR